MKRVSITFITICFASCFCSESEKKSKEGKPLPDFNTKLSDNSNWVTISRKPTERLVALYYFNPHCPFCKDQTSKIIDDIGYLDGIQFYYIHPIHFMA